MVAHCNEEVKKPDNDGSAYPIRLLGSGADNLLPPISISICMVPLLLKVLRLLIINAR